MVRRSIAVAMVGVALGSPIPTAAQSFTYGKLVAGQVQRALVYGSGTSWCFVEDGSTEFQINQAATKAVISFNELTYFDGTNYYQLNGQTILAFSSGMGGNLHFKLKPNLPDAVHNPAFTNFTQTYSAPKDQLVVGFNIVFPACTLPIYAVYDAP
jgi:hypothetical protein